MHVINPKFLDSIVNKREQSENFQIIIEFSKPCINIYLLVKNINFL